MRHRGTNSPTRCRWSLTVSLSPTLFSSDGGKGIQWTATLVETQRERKWEAKTAKEHPEQRSINPPQEVDGSNGLRDACTWALTARQRLLGVGQRGHEHTVPVVSLNPGCCFVLPPMSHSTWLSVSSGSWEGGRSPFASASHDNVSNASTLLYWWAANAAERRHCPARRAPF